MAVGAMVSCTASVGPLLTLPPTLPLPPDDGAHVPLLRQPRMMRSASRLLRAESDPRVGLLAVLFVAFVRVALEGGVSAQGLEAWLPMLVERTTFYMAVFLAFCAVLRAVLPNKPRGIPNIVAIGLLLGLSPPILAALAPSLGSSGPARLADWQLDLQGPDLAPVESLALWTSIVLCGVFTRWTTGSWGRALAATSLAWLGLAAIVVAVPSMLVRAPSVAAGAGVIFAATGLVLFLLTRRELAWAVFRGAPRALPFLGLVVLGSLRVSATGLVERTFLVLWILLVTAPHVVREGDLAGESVWLLSLSALLVLNVLLVAPLVALSAAALLLARTAGLSASLREAPARWCVACASASCAFFVGGA
jgi:hypothetical protein